MAVKSTLMPSLVNAGKITQEQANEIQKIVKNAMFLMCRVL